MNRLHYKVHKLVYITKYLFDDLLFKMYLFEGIAWIMI